MKISIAALCATAALAATSASAATVVVDFEGLAHDGASEFYSSGLEVDGLTFSNIGNFNDFRVWGRGDGRNADPGGATLMSNLMPTETYVRRADRQLFDLISLDIADWTNAGTLTWVSFGFTDAAGHLTHELRSLDALRGLQTLTFNRTGLQSFSYFFVPNQTPGSPGWGQIDNLTIDDRVTAGVPEPATWAMMILGFGAVGATLRRRRLAFA